MPITTNDFAKLTDDLESIFNEAANEKIAESVGMMLFNVKDEVRKTHDHLLLHGNDGIQEVAEGSDLPRANSEEGDNIIYTQKYYGVLVTITKLMRKFDLFDQIESQASSTTDDAFDKIDQSFADIFLNGWSTSHVDVYGSTVTDTTAPDGLSFFNVAHTVPNGDNTFSNVITSSGTLNPTLSREAVVATKAAGRKYKDKNSITRPIKFDTIVVGPDQEDLAHRIIDSTMISGSNNNDTNKSIASIKIVVWDRLDSDSQGNDTSAYWFMLDSKKSKETLRSFFAERPSLDSPDQVYTNKNWDWSLDFIYSRGLGFPAYVQGSKGTNAA